MGEVKIVHLSDLHISEHLLREPDSHFKLPHRYGHDVQVFLALDRFLKENEWDILAITGDLTRIGNAESFEVIRNWLLNKINIGDVEVGLQLSHGERHFVVVPGNHDRFNGDLAQTSLDKYHGEFERVPAGAEKTFVIRGQRVRFHLFDSSWEKGSFAVGRVASEDLAPRTIRDDTIEIALLHHHFIQAPKHKREADTELENSTEVAGFMLNSGFDGVMFGHTHQSYVGFPSTEALTGLLPDRRAQGKIWRKLVPKFLLRRLSDNGLVAFKREAARNGQLPTLDTYFDYLYLLKKGHSLSGPAMFRTIGDFYKHLAEHKKKDGIKELIESVQKKRMLISLSPSACQAEAKWKGFHVITFCKGKEPRWDRYQFGQARFEKVASPAHVS